MNDRIFVVDGIKCQVISSAKIVDRQVLLLSHPDLESPFMGNVVCVDENFRILHRFSNNMASGIWISGQNIILDYYGFVFIYDSTSFNLIDEYWAK